MQPDNTKPHDPKPHNAKPLALVIAAAVMVAWCATSTAEPPALDRPADLILSGGHVKTSSGWTEAVAIRSGVIVALGDTKSITALRGPGTRTVELAGATVLPGLHDVHVHPMYAGITERDRCKIAQGSTLQETLKGVKECAGRTKPGEWVIGGQWDAPALGGIPDKSQLDAVTADHPTYLEDTSGHSVWVNSRALALAGITKGTRDPTGGIIERDSTGAPTGILRESATELVYQHIPKPTGDALRSALKWSLDEMLSFGITSYTEAAVGFVAGPRPELDVYAQLAKEGLPKQRATLCITWAPGDEATEQAIALRNLYARPRVSPSCVKIFLDGVPTDSHTAAMLDPYADTLVGRNDKASRYGLLQVKPDVLNAAVTRFDRMGLTVKFHAAGDAAVHEGLDAIAAARKANGFTGQMHNVGHCTFVAKADIARARAIGATFEVSPYLWGPSPINDSITQAVGPQLIARVWPVREMLEARALVVPGSDWSVVPSVNPWLAIESLVTRERPGGSPDSFGKAEAISLPQALELFTENAAEQEGVSDQVGRIEVGMLADVIVVDQNPYEVPVTRVHNTRVKMTFVGGEKVFDAAVPAKR
jgi:predicted amidohydrolase YtcJ